MEREGGRGRDGSRNSEMEGRKGEDERQKEDRRGE